MRSVLADLLNIQVRLQILHLGLRFFRNLVGRFQIAGETRDAGLGALRPTAHRKIRDQPTQNQADHSANQERLLDDIQETVSQALDGQLPAGRVRQCSTSERGHGRVEERHCVIIEDLRGIRDRQAWPHLRTVGMCRRERTVHGETTTEVCYFIGSRRMAARRYAAALRNHWGIENYLHWQLDVSFHEDANRVENRPGAENLSLFRKLALSLLKQNPRQESMARKRKAAAVEPGYLAEIITGATKVEEV